MWNITANNNFKPTPYSNWTDASYSQLQALAIMTDLDRIISSMNQYRFEGLRDYDKAKEELMTYFNLTNRNWTEGDNDLVTALLYTE